MNNRTRLAALAAAGLIAAVPLIGTAWSANEAAAPAATAPGVAAQKTQILRTSDDVAAALDAAGAARIAIFNAKPDKAKEFVADLVASLGALKENADGLTVASAQKADADERYIPFQTSLSLADDFVPGNEHAVKLTEASTYLAMGDQKKAAEILADAGIDARLRAALLPVNASIEHAARAQDHLAAGAWYEANVALKAITDGVVMDSYALDSVPAQGTAG